MEISVLKIEGRYELVLQGRMDANWSERVGQAIESAIQGGHHEVGLNFGQVDYISSAGIRVLLKYYKQLKAARGLLQVLNPPESVLTVLQLSGIANMLVADTGKSAPANPPTTPGAKATDEPRRCSRGGVEFETHSLAPTAQFVGKLHGKPDDFFSGNHQAASSHHLRCTPDLIAVGLGAFGRNRAEAGGRFGETLVVAGQGVTQPTDGSSLPDYQVTQGQLMPELELLYGISAQGGFSDLVRFEAASSSRGVIGFSALVDAALELTSHPAAAIVVLAEAASVIGCTILKSPDSGKTDPPLDFPRVRDWLNFTTERADERQLVLIVGFVEKNPLEGSRGFLRPIGSETKAQGHFHAVVFPYRPIPKGRLDLGETAAQLLDSQSARTVMHLLADSREFEGVGETDLLRGGCWISPLRQLEPSPNN
jgi:anti-anti-sigma factor